MPNKDPEKERAYQRRWRKANADYLRKWRAENPDKVRVYDARHRDKHRDKRRAYARRWRTENPSKSNLASRRWEKAHPEQRRAQDARRRALKASAPQGNLAAAAAYEQILREGICELCGSKGPIEIDHIEPLSKGGAHDWMNMAGLCKSCNSSKGDKSLLHFLLDRRRK